MVDEGLEKSTAYTDLVRKTYTRKHGSFIDERAEALVEEVEQAVEELTHGRSPLANSQTGSTAATPHSGRLVLNQEYLNNLFSLAYQIGRLLSIEFVNM